MLRAISRRETVMVAKSATDLGYPILGAAKDFDPIIHQLGRVVRYFFPCAASVFSVRMCGVGGRDPDVSICSVGCLARRHDPRARSPRLRPLSSTRGALVGATRLASGGPTLNRRTHLRRRRLRPRRLCDPFVSTRRASTVGHVPHRPTARNARAAQVGASLAPPPGISLGIAALTWMVGWFLGNVAGGLVLAASGDNNLPVGERPVWLSAGMAVAFWVPQLAALFVASRSFATGRLLRDFSLRFAPVDLVGIPIGVFSQIALLKFVYWPLRKWWPDTFADKQLERNARDLTQRAHGIWVVVLVVVIVFGAPIVEELVYRGLLQGAARRRLNDAIAVLGVAAFFALIHFRTVEYPGLFVFGVVLGCCAAMTRRLGMGIVAHMAFNATALVLVAR